MQIDQVKFSARSDTTNQLRSLSATSRVARVLKQNARLSLALLALTACLSPGGIVLAQEHSENGDQAQTVSSTHRAGD
jgi:hypothetical protein